MNSKEVALRLIDVDVDLLKCEWSRVQSATQNGDGFGFLESKKQIDFILVRIAANVKLALESTSTGEGKESPNHDSGCPCKANQNEHLRL